MSEQRTLRIIKSPWVVFGFLLFLLLLAQIKILQDRLNGTYQYDSLKVGSALPFTVLGWDTISIVERSSERCHLAFICLPGCGACGAMADRLTSEPLGASVRESPVLWFLWGDSSTVATWTSLHALPPQTVLRLAGKRQYPWRRPVLGDVWVTPMRIVLTSDLVVRDARPSDSIPNDSVVGSLCRKGGIAPRNLSEYLEQMMGGGT